MSATNLNDEVTGPPASITEGARFAGEYVLVRRLEADVWLARDEVGDRDVSLHFTPLVKDDRAVEELRVDVKRNRQLIHPNILRVYELAVDGERMAVSMEAFEGQSLASQIDAQHGTGGNLSVIHSWAQQVVRTLEEAHRINVLHRDLTPFNIFLTAAGKAIVANFGISRTLRDAMARAGVPQPAGFTSPQLRAGNAATRADDIYSFGATLFAATVGQAPTVAGDVSPQAPTGLSAESLAALEGAGLPANWKATILACLATDPEARPKSATDLGRRLGELSAVATSPPAEEPAAITASETAPVAPAPAPSESEPAAASLVAEPQASPVPDAAMPAMPVVKLVTPVEEWAKPDVGPRRNVSQPASPLREPAAAKQEPARSVTPAAVDLTPLGRPATEPKKDAPKDAPAPRPEERATGPKPADSVLGWRPEKSRLPIPILAGAALLIVVIAILLLPRHKAPSVATDTPHETPKAFTPAPAAPETPSPANSALAAREAALAKARQDASAAEKALDDLRKQHQAVEDDLAKTEKGLEEKSASMKAMRKAAEDLDAQRKKLEGNKSAAEQAANELKKQAVEKERLFEESVVALKEFEEKNAEGLTAPQRAEADLAELQKRVDEQRGKLSDSATAVAAGDAALKQQLKAIADREREVADLTKQGQPKAIPAPPSPGPDTRSQVSAPAPVVVIATTPAPSLPPVNPEAPIPTGGNSLGMRFVPVGDVEFCIWLTRLKDFEVFAKATDLRSKAWKAPGFKQEADHPVVNVSWDQAIAFCDWLTEKEHKEKILPANQFYRLPTDLEWSKAVGLPEETESTPEKRDMDVPGVYPWGTQWPPPPGAGNYTGEETGPDSSIKGYNDGYSWTSPVGSFAANKYGLYDMGGNAWQWCMDTWNGQSKNRVLRGASWYNGGLRLSLLSSCRVNAAPDTSTDNYGFRVVRATKAAGKPGKK